MHLWKNMYSKRFYIGNVSSLSSYLRTVSVFLCTFRVVRASTIGVEGPNEERIESDLWGACRCWRNNIIVNFADCGIVRVYREVGSSSKRANNEGARIACIYSRSSWFFVVVRTFSASGHPDTRRGARKWEKKNERMRKERPAVSVVFCSRRIKRRLKNRRY